MAYARHMEFVRVDDPAHRASILDHYRLDPSDVGAVFCAMGNRPDDPTPPREVLIATSSTLASYEAEIEDYNNGDDRIVDEPVLEYCWIVSQGRVRFDEDHRHALSLAEANDRLIQEYHIFDLDRYDQIGQAIADLVRSMRSEGLQTGTLKISAINGVEINNILWDGEPDSFARTPMLFMDVADEFCKEFGVDQPLASLTVSTDGIVALRVGEAAKVFAVDLAEFPARPAPAVTNGPGF